MIILNIFSVGFSIFVAMIEINDECKDIYGQVLLAESIATVIIGLFSIVCNTFLFVGAHSQKRVLLYPALISFIVDIIVSLIFTIAILALSPIQGAIKIGFEVAGIALYLYFFVVIRSYFIELKMASLN